MTATMNEPRFLGFLNQEDEDDKRLPMGITSIEIRLMHNPSKGVVIYFKGGPGDGKYSLSLTQEMTRAFIEQLNWATTPIAGRAWRHGRQAMIEDGIGRRAKGTLSR